MIISVMTGRPRQRTLLPGLRGASGDSTSKTRVCVQCVCMCEDAQTRKRMQGWPRGINGESREQGECIQDIKKWSQELNRARERPREFYSVPLPKLFFYPQTRISYSSFSFKISQALSC
jgi:hypothetical protein